MVMDARSYRRVIGHFATGVGVLTTCVEGRLHGMTANSLASVSLDPLLLLVCVDKTAEAHRQCAAAGRFAVNILRGDQEQIARTFAARGLPERDRLRGVPYRLGPNGTPILDGCLAWLECELDDRHDGGDHTIFVGRVLHGEVGSAGGPPLLFYRGAYKTR